MVVMTPLSSNGSSIHCRGALFFDKWPLDSTGRLFHSDAGVSGSKQARGGIRPLRYPRTRRIYPNNSRLSLVLLC